MLYMMDSTTITLFDNILKGVAAPEIRQEKGGMKVHTVMKYHVGVPMVVQLTSAAKHDHYLLKEVHLPKDSTLAMDRGYVDIAQFQRLTEEGVLRDQNEENLSTRNLNPLLMSTRRTGDAHRQESALQEGTHP